ncbi:MAG: amidohydrolase [Phycisphaerae bacterium]|nr:amidohydrolase [Phycisphaerae bacterium]
MIVDCHTHIWKSASQLGRAGKIVASMAKATRQATIDLPDASPENHLSACRPVDKAIVLGFRSAYLDAHVPNDYVADYVRAHSARLIGFAGVDPAEPVEAIEELRRAHAQLGFKGIAVSPPAQDFHPSSTGALRVFAEACQLGMPVLFHQGACPAPEAKMEYGRPFLLDEICRELPDLKIIVGHMGYPWVDECIELLAKQPNAHADISGLIGRPWRIYNALLLAHERRVMDKLLFGSNFPFASATSAIEALYSINQLSHGTSLPTIPRERLRAVVESNALTVLGITPPSQRSHNAHGPVLDDDL